MVSFCLRASEAIEEQNVIHIILTSKQGGFITVWLWGCQLGQWCMKLPRFIGMAFNQFLLGICPWLCGGGSSLKSAMHLPTSYSPIPLMPHTSHFHPALIQSVLSRMQGCLLSPTIVSDWLCRATVPSSFHSSQCLWIQPELAQFQQTLPPRSSQPFISS